MALEPRTVSAPQMRKNPELVEMTHRFWVGVVFDHSSALDRNERFHSG